MDEFARPSLAIPAGVVPPDGQNGETEDQPPGAPNHSARRDVDHHLLEQHVEDKKAERALRKKYAGRAFWFAVCGIGFWFFLLLWTGCATYYRDRAPFSDNVLIAITAATSVNLFAAFLGVIRGLFPVNGRPPGK